MPCNFGNQRLSGYELPQPPESRDFRTPCRQIVASRSKKRDPLQTASRVLRVFAKNWPTRLGRAVGILAGEHGARDRAQPGQDAARASVPLPRPAPATPRDEL